MKNNFIKKILPNGVTVYLYKDKNCKRKFASYNVKYGSLGFYDKFYYDGKDCHVTPAMAHFIEHTLIEHSKYGNMMHVFMDENYDCNGITYSDITSYYCLGIDNFEEMLEKLINMVDCPVFTKKDIEDVKGPVCEELNNNFDNKYIQAFTCNKRNLINNYEAAPESNNSLGTIESTMNITYDEVKLCYDAYYYDENKFLVIGGNIDIDKIMVLLEKIYSKIPAHPKKIKPYDYPDDFSIRCKETVLHLPTESNFIVYSFKFKKPKDISNLDLNLYLLIFNKLTFASYKPELEQMLTDKIAIGGIGKSIDIFNDAVTLSYYTDTYKEKEFIEKVKSLIKNAKFDKEEFELVKRELIVSEISRMDYIYRIFRNFPLLIEFSENIMEVENIKKTTLKDIIDISKKIDFSLSTTTIVKNKKN